MASAIARRHGVACQVSKVGEANVVDAMLAVGAVLGGEGNGGVIDPRVVLVRDSCVAMALVLEQMCAAGRLISLESLAGDLPRLVMRKTKFDLAPGIGGPALAAALERVASGFPEARVSRLDGLRLDWPTGWLLVRASNTEPIVRIVAEATSSTAVAAAIATARRVIAGPHEPSPRA
jgi:phosphomannomutase